MITGNESQVFNKNGRKAGLKIRNSASLWPTLVIFHAERANVGHSSIILMDKGRQRSKSGLLSLLSCSIPGVFPESPRWLLLSERSADMNSFSERRNSNRDVRDDESFTGVCAHDRFWFSELELLTFIYLLFISAGLNGRSVQVYLLQCISKHEYLSHTNTKSR